LKIMPFITKVHLAEGMKGVLKQQERIGLTGSELALSWALKAGSGSV